MLSKTGENWAESNSQDTKMDWKVPSYTNHYAVITCMENFTLTFQEPAPMTVNLQPLINLIVAEELLVHLVAKNTLLLTDNPQLVTYVTKPQTRSLNPWYKYVILADITNTYITPPYAYQLF